VDPLHLVDVVWNPAAPLVPFVATLPPAILDVAQLAAVPQVDVWVKGRKLWKNVLAEITGEKSGGSSATS